jgi:outer membrane protein OmpA-like peptidoglycan-associated protein
MTLIKSAAKHPARESWINPREALRNKVRRVIFDRPPLMVSPPNRTVYLQEGGFHNLTLRDADLPRLGDDLRKAIERKSGDAKPKFETAFLGVYPTCCHSQCKDWLCTAAKEYEEERIPFDWAKFFSGLRGLWPLLLLLLLGLLIYAAYASYRDYCMSDPDSFWCTFRQAPSTEPPPPVAPPSETTPPVDTTPPPSTPYPTNVQPDHPPTAPTQVAPDVHAPPPAAGPPPYAAPPEPVFKLPFLEDKSSLLRETQNSLRDAAMRALETDKLVHMRIMPLGPPEEDEELYRRRYQAVKDELVRLGVPADRIQPEGTGPNDLIIRQRVLPTSRAGRQRVTMELIPDPLAPDDDQ